MNTRETKNAEHAGWFFFEEEVYTCLLSRRLVMNVVDSLVTLGISAWLPQTLVWSWLVSDWLWSYPPRRL